MQGRGMPRPCIVFIQGKSMSFSISIFAFCKRGELPEQEVLRYTKLIRPHAAVACVYLKSPAGSFANKNELLEAEARIVAEKLPKGAHVVALSEDGKNPGDSRMFAQWLSKKQLQAAGLVFVIGSAHGLSPSLKQTAHEVISLSGLTFSHCLAQLVLLEQIYRAFTILKGHPYHK
jgi:23S rRNA (pseudouridine1915-N3)-methyltransferase